MKLESRYPNHMEFRYHVVKDRGGIVQAMTYTSVSLWKEDMLSHEVVSKKIEKVRETDPTFLTEKVMSTGSTFTEGTHVYVNSEAKDLRFLQRTFFDSVEHEFEKGNYGKLVFRDFRKITFCTIRRTTGDT